MKGTVKAFVPRSTRRRLLHTVRSQVVFSAPPLPDEAFMTELRASLKPEIERFSDYLGRDLVPLWGYDHV